MKKTYDIEKTEERIRRGFSAAKKKIRYGGSIVKEALYGEKEKTETKKERGGFFSRPAVQIAGAFLAAAVVGGVTFGVLRYMESRAPETSLPETDTSDSADQATENTDTPDTSYGAELISDFNGIKKYDYEKLLSEYEKSAYDGDPNGFALLLTGGEAYPVNVFRYSERTKTKDNEYKTEYHRPDVYSLPAVPFGGDLVLHNNVDGREMTVVEVRMKKTDGLSTILRSLDEVFKSVYSGKAGTYEVTVDATWDGTEGKHTVYRIAFDLIKESSYTGRYKKWYSENEMGRSYVSVESGGKTYYGDAARRSYTRLVSDSVKEKKGFTDSCDPINVDYSFDFKIENNVYDREMTVISVTVSESLFDDTYKKEMTLDELYKYLKKADAGKYYVTLQLTWDKYPLTAKGDSAYVYNTVLIVTKRASAFFSGSVFKLAAAEPDDDVRLKTEYENTRAVRVISEEADAAGWEIYKYNAGKAKDGDGYTDFEAGLYVVDEYGSCILNFDPETMLYAPDTLIYVKETPSGHSMFFFTALKTYSDPDFVDTWTYSYDTVTGELKLFTVPRTENDHKKRNGNLLFYDEEGGRILLKAYNAEADPQKVSSGEFVFDEDTYAGTAKLVWDGENYKFKVLPEPEKTPDTEEETKPVPTEFDPTDRLIIHIAGESHYPAAVYKSEYKNGVKQKENIFGASSETYVCGPGQALEVEYNNRERRIYSVMVNGDMRFDDFSEAFDYMEENKRYYPDVITVSAEITWDKEALSDPEADRTTYTFEFGVSFTDPYAETQTPESDPSYKYLSLYLAVKIGDEEFYPGVSAVNTYENGTVRVMRYDTEVKRYVWRAGEEKISVENMTYGFWHFHGVTVDGTEKFDTQEEAFSHISQKDGVFLIEVEASWDSSATPYKGETTYTYAFELEVR